MESPQESDQPGGGREPDSVTPEQLAHVIRRMEAGFYDTPEVREEIARKAREDLGL